MNESADDLVSTHEAAAMLGVPEPEFSRVVRHLDLTPARAGSKTTPRMWARRLIEELNASPEAEEAREATKRKEAIAQRHAGLAERYPNWHDALRPAAVALFNFNRYSKWEVCTPLRRRELYELKDRILQMFYEMGLAKEVVLHTVEGDEGECQACAGTTKTWRGTICPDCAGTGKGRAESREYVLFCFLIDGQYFNWHAPRKGVAWDYELTDPAVSSPHRKDWQPNSGEKPILLTSEEDFIDAEACLRFVLRRRAEEKQELKRQESARRGEEKRRQWLEKKAAAQQPDAPPGE